MELLWWPMLLVSYFVVVICLGKVYAQLLRRNLVVSETYEDH